MEETKEIRIFKEMEEKRTVPEYFLGLDMGTGSLGWAVTDEQYRLLRLKGKDLWGVRMFDEAKTSAEARLNRTARRRRRREKARIGLLYEFFADEIVKKDPGFYERVKDSKYHLEDKKEQVPFALFADTGYTDVQYYEEYPTIYHLRKELIESDQPHDVRLVFLALLNMFKARGHFLNENLNAAENIEKIDNLYPAFAQLSAAEGFCFTEQVDTAKLDQLLCRKDISRTQKTEAIGELLGISKKNRAEYEIVKLICGLEGKLSTIFGEESFDEEHRKSSLSFRAADFDMKLAEIENQLGEERLEFLFLVERIHDYGLLGSIMKGYAYLSQARVDEYEKHRRDLKKLKMVIRKYAPDKYDSMFRTMEDGNYSAYVGSVNSGIKIRRNVKKRTQAELYATVKELLKNLPEDADVRDIKAEMENETFLPKQRTASNGVIPNQVHLAEMKKILQNAEKYLTFLTEKDEETGLSVSEKIIALYSFRIPYYVGPLKGQGKAWVVRKNSGPVYPWNFEDAVDTRHTAEEFIARMVRHCTYLTDEQALPKNSYLYERFMVLNELNNLKIRGEKPSVELKQDIYRDLFLKGKKVSGKNLSDYLTAKGIILPGENAVSGIDQNFHSALTSVGKFKGVFGDAICWDDTVKMMEDIIFWGTVYGEDKKFFRERIKEVYGEKLNSAQLKRISGFRFKDWGRLSRSFLEMKGCLKDDGQILPLIEMMWQKNENLMELLSDRYTYMEELNHRVSMAEKTLAEFEYDDLENMRLSAPVKRMVWQTLLVLKELREGLKYDPKRIFVEMARENQENGKRTVSRKKRLQELYKNCKEEGRDWAKELGDLDEAQLRNKKLYLYCTQKGRCMYTGEPIELSDLFQDNKYDIDHIYPKHFVKDDSLENNLVLVKKEKNANKSDTYPLDASIRQRQKQWWFSLLSKDGGDGFITREKYERLTRTHEFTPEELTGFISRQIVETRQGTKVITKILEQAFSNTEIVYVKADNVSEFRHKFSLLKTRSVNDFHHAQDAYLNIVVGNAYMLSLPKIRQILLPNI